MPSPRPLQATQTQTPCSSRAGNNPGPLGWCRFICRLLLEGQRLGFTLNATYRAILLRSLVHILF